MQSLSQATHIHAAPTPLLPVITSLASAAKAISPWEKCCPLNCVNVDIWKLLFKQIRCPCVLIEVLISSSDRDVRCYLCSLEWKIHPNVALKLTWGFVLHVSIPAHMANQSCFSVLGRAVHVRLTNGTEPTGAAQPMKCITSAWRKVNSSGNTRERVSPLPPFMLTKSES